MAADLFTIGVVDRSRPFIPPHLSPLPHTEVWAELPTAIRLRYNQLFASCYHEHFVFLERMLAGHALPALRLRYRGRPMGPRLSEFIDDERRHTAWFHALHRACEPELYADNYHYFVRVRGPAMRVFSFCADRPWRFPFCLWLAMIIEERTILASRELVEAGSSLEPHFVELHRLHSLDEARHVGIDGELLRDIWPRLSAPAQAMNRWLFVTILREFFRLPKRAAWNVVLQLAKEFPAVAPALPRMRRELLALDERSSYLAGIYSREREPRTFALADRLAQMRRLEHSLLDSEQEMAV